MRPVSGTLSHQRPSYGPSGGSDEAAVAAVDWAACMLANRRKCGNGANRKWPTAKARPRNNFPILLPLTRPLPRGEGLGGGSYSSVGPNRSDRSSCLDVFYPGGRGSPAPVCLLYTSDAADDLLCVDLGGRRIIKK